MNCVRKLAVVGACVHACLLLPQARAETWYVKVNGSDAAAGTNWPTAKKTIQAAVDLAVDGDTVLVADGTYASGGRTLEFCQTTNRVAILRAVTVRSLNGPAVTTIRGNPVFGELAVRCAYVGTNATLAGFTLTDGATGAHVPKPDTCGGGVLCASSGTVSNCVIVGNRSFMQGGGAYGGTLHQCTLSGNSAAFGGGAYAAHLNDCAIRGNKAAMNGGGTAWHCTVRNCVIEGNTAESGGGCANGDKLYDCRLSRNLARGSGGGAIDCTLTGCIIDSNAAASNGGGAERSTLTDCILRDNAAGNLGGGAHVSSLHRCLVVTNSAVGGGGISYGDAHRSTLQGNTATSFGGGSFYSSLFNCVVAFNSVRDLFGGGTIGGTQINCTIVGNTAGRMGGGAHEGLVINCVLVSNTASTGANGCSNAISHSCTFPLPDAGLGNIAADPGLVSPAAGDFRLTAGSPCVDAGANERVRGTTDRGGGARIVNGRVDIGAFEFAPDADGPRDQEAAAPP